MLRLILAAAIAALPFMAQAEARLIGSYTWSGPGPRFGGISAIDLTSDGTGFIALSDRATLFYGSLQRRNGRIVGVSASPARVLRPNGEPGGGDTEGIDLAPDGSFVIAFENGGRFWAYDGIGQPARPLSRNPAHTAFPANKIFESVAVAPDGSVYAMAEAPLADGTVPVFRLRDGTWREAFRFAASGGFLVTGADFGPDGHLYVLERRMVGLAFRSRVRRITLAPLAQEFLLTTPGGRHGNLEGLSVWRDATGAMRLTLIGDNNFNPLLPTEIVEYRLD